MVPRVKLAYDRVSLTVWISFLALTSHGLQRVFDIIHPDRRNLTAIRGYKRLGGLPDDPSTDPQDRSWYGPHDRLFKREESLELNFQPGPDYGPHLFVCVAWKR